MNRKLTSLVAVVLAFTSMTAFAMTDAQLQAIAEQRLLGDRTGACMALAVVEKDSTARAFVCADPANLSRIGADSAFEIGSVSKTMTAALLAEWIVQGEASLDDALADWLPADVRVPTFAGQPILLRHIVTHTSGLPPLPESMQQQMDATNPDDPYAALSEQDVWNALAEVTLSAAPGSDYAYSNFAMMVLSSAIAHRAGDDFERWLKQRMFAPLGMDSAYVNTPPAGIRVAAGHTPNTRLAPAWHFPSNLAGVGGVRATLEDMVRYVQGQLGLLDAAIVPALQLTQKPVTEQFAMNWMQFPLGARRILMHEGGTGGVSAFVALDVERQRGVVVLSDTALHSSDGLGKIGLHLVDESVDIGAPRLSANPPQALLDALAGEYRLQGAMHLTLRQRGGQLLIQAEGQGEYPMGYDDTGDFFALDFDATLRPQAQDDGRYAFVWFQGGAALSGVRVDTAAGTSPELPAEDLQAYVGQYPLLPGLTLRIRVQQGQLQAQATGQAAFLLDASGQDTFAAPAFGIKIVFKRDAQGMVDSLDLHQGGKVLGAKRETSP